MLLVLLFSMAAFAVDERIAEVVISGNRNIDAAAIMAVVKSRSGESLSRDKVNQDIKEIYKLGFFEDVKAESKKSDKGVVLVYNVVERPIVREIRIIGNKEIATEKIREAIELKTNSIFSAKAL